MKLLSYFALAIGVVCAAWEPGPAQGQDFASYPPDVHLGTAAKGPDFSGEGARYKKYRTRIRDGASQGVNFAGHYALIVIGCGTGCSFAYIVDLMTGQIGSFPYGGEEQYQMSLHFTRDSRLLRVRWMTHWSGNSCTEKDLLIEGLNWRVLSQRQTLAIDGSCDMQ